MGIVEKDGNGLEENYVTSIRKTQTQDEKETQDCSTMERERKILPGIQDSIIITCINKVKLQYLLWYLFPDLVDLIEQTVIYVLYACILLYNFTSFSFLLCPIFKTITHWKRLT